MYVKRSCVGLGFLCQFPYIAPIVPGRGVVGHYIDRCIIIIEERAHRAAVTVKPSRCGLPHQLYNVYIRKSCVCGSDGSYKTF